MATNVKARVELKVRVCKLMTTTPTEVGQRFYMHKCVTTCSLSEWNWRWAAAKSVLCSGTTTYTSYGNAIGRGWV